MADRPTSLEATPPLQGLDQRLVDGGARVPGCKVPTDFPDSLRVDGAKGRVPDSALAYWKRWGYAEPDWRVMEGCGAPRPQSEGSEVQPVAVLFAHRGSYYKTIPGCDVWDADRDARNWPGGCPVVAHPPCRAWGQLAAFAKPRADEKDLARFAVAMIREWGGILEHPAKSLLWEDMKLPAPGMRDSYGGRTISAPQMWWGHWCEKPTRFYVVGCEPHEEPPIPFLLGGPSHMMGKRGPTTWRPEFPKSMRELTPPHLGHWMVRVARVAGQRRAKRSGASGPVNDPGHGSPGKTKNQ